MTSPAGAPILFVREDDGSLRVCIDYRALNKITVAHRYPLPLIPESLNRLAKATFFSKLDLQSAYNLVRIADGDEWKTAFRCRYGHFEYTVAPFGLNNAPAAFQHLVNDALRPFLDTSCIAHLNEIIVYSKTRADHTRHLTEVARSLMNAQLWVNPRSSKFYEDRVDYLGYVVGKGRVRMDQRQVQVVLDWPRPASVKETQSFIGFANVYRRFIRNYLAIL